MPKDVIDDVDDTDTEDAADDVADSGDETTSDEPLSFQEAFDRAKDEHSKAAKAGEHALDDEDSTEDDEDAETPPARKGKAAPAPDKAAATTAKPSDDRLLTDAEYEALEKKHPNDPAGLRKDLERAFTKKTQALSEQRRSAERLAPYADIINAYEEDPEATVLALAKQHGLTLGRADETTEGTEDQADAVDAVMAEFKEKLGPELEYLADGLAPAITALVERLTKTTVDRETAPMREQTKAILGKQAVEQTDLVMKSFGEKHPDWKDHEDEMFELSQKLSPKGMTEGEYLEHLYRLVKADETPEQRQKAIEREAAKLTKAAIAKMRKGAEDTETETESVPERGIKHRRPANATFEDAAAAARQGIRWED